MPVLPPPLIHSHLNPIHTVKIRSLFLLINYSEFSAELDYIIAVAKLSRAAHQQPNTVQT